MLHLKCSPARSARAFFTPGVRDLQTAKIIAPIAGRERAPRADMERRSSGIFYQAVPQHGATARKPDIAPASHTMSRWFAFSNRTGRYWPPHEGGRGATSVRKNCPAAACSRQDRARLRLRRAVPAGHRRQGEAEQRTCAVRGAHFPLDRARRRRARGARRGRAGRSARPTTPPPRRAASGSRPTAALTGSRSSTTSRSRRSARIAVAPSDPNVVYVGSGEANIRGNVAAGNGIYKSTDAGKTWTHVWKQEGQIGTMVVHPKNPDIAFAAVLGHAFGPNPERGVYRTQDGGKTWQQVLKKDADTGASDVAHRPDQPAHRLRRASGRRAGCPWELTSGGPGSGLYVSRDGGDTWKQLTGRRPARGHLGQGRRRGRAVRRPARLRADRSGEGRPVPLRRRRRELGRWSNDHHALRQRAWYYSTLTVDPTQRRRRLVPAGAAAPEHRRRQDVSQHVKGAAPRRPPRPLDRPEEPEADDRRQRRRRGHLDRTAARRGSRRRCRSRSSTTSASTTACPTTSPARCRTSAPRSGPSNSLRERRHRARRLARRRRRRGRATSSPTRAIRTSSTPANTAASSRATTTARGRPRNVSVYPDNPSGHGARGHEIPLPVDRADRRSRRTTRRSSTTARNVLFRTTRRRPDAGTRSAPT